MNSTNNLSFSPTSLESVDLLSPSFDQQQPRGSDLQLSPSNNLEQINEQEVQQQQRRTEEAVEEATDNNKSSSLSIIYQIDFDVEHVGKNKPQSKRMAIWRYQMNGSEHETKLIWSTHSGKYTISVDGIDVYNNIAKGSVLEHKWKWSHRRGCVSNDTDDKDTVPLRVIACRKPPTRSSKDFRCYEFIIGGCVFRDLPTMEEGPGSPTSATREDFHNEENAYQNNGKLMSILDVIEPGWRSDGFA